MIDQKFYNKRLCIYLKDPLYRNSLFIMLTSVSSAAFGFLFWALAARIYTTKDVGIATALISAVGIITLLSGFGLDLSVIRFFPEKNSKSILSTCTIITALFASVFGIISLLTIDIWLPGLKILRVELPFFYLMILISNSLVPLTNNSFLALRKAEFSFLQSIIIGSRVIFLIPLAFIGELGILGAIGISLVMATSSMIIFLNKIGAGLKLEVNIEFLREALNFSIGNYFINLFITIPNLVLPIMILNILGPSDAAFFYLSFCISSILFMIPTAISTSLLVEGCHGESIKETAKKSVIATFSLLIPSVAVLYIIGPQLLANINPEYGRGFYLLRLLSVSSFLMAIFNIYISINRVQKKIKFPLISSCLIFSSIMIFSYLFMARFGLIGVGYAWIVGYGIGIIFIGLTCSIRIT